MAAEKATYTHGHHASVLRNHTRRTTENSAAFLIPHIKETDRILDIGCGPGTITVGLARLVPNGAVIGGDSSAEVIEQAKQVGDAHEFGNLSFQQLDANALPFEDSTFDVTFCHQVLQHVADPVSVLKEARRVTKANGIVAARDADYRSFAWFPASTDLDDWLVLYQQVAKANGAEPNAGRCLPHWSRQAGFSNADITFTWQAWHFQGEDARAHGDSFGDRVIHSGIASSAEKYALADKATLDRLSKGWKAWSQADNNFLIIPNGEVLCRVRK